MAHTNASHTSSGRIERRKKKGNKHITEAVDGKVTGSVTQMEKESVMKRANRKGQVLRDKETVKDKAKRAGSILLNWVTTPLNSSENSSESLVLDPDLQLENLVPATTC